MSDWISVKDRLPKFYEPVLVSDGIVVEVCELSEEKLWQIPGYLQEPNIGITFWMPFPDSPLEKRIKKEMVRKNIS